MNPVWNNKFKDTFLLLHFHNKTFKKMKQKSFEQMPVVNPYSAGIDVGSRSHFVAVGQDIDKDVREFGVYTQDHQLMVDFLKSRGVMTVAMESTGNYWQSLFSSLQSAGFEVMLVSGHQTKNVRAKTDVKDCMWIQKLHSLGLLRGCFMPDRYTSRIRTVHRHRSSLTEESVKMVNKMQKSLRLMNVRLDVVVSDITGKTGMSILESILKGERDGKVLSNLADPRVKKSREEIARALEGTWEEELLFELGHCYDLYRFLEEKIRSCDKKIEGILNEFTQEVSIGEEEKSTLEQYRRVRKQPDINLPELSYKMYHVDLFSIESVSYGTVLSLISEIGYGIYEFKTAKQFASFLRLAPNNRISGGKVISSRTPKGANRFALTLRNAANSIDKQKDGALTRFFKRIAYKKGRGAAITATARKLAVIIWNMIVKREPYKPMDVEEYQERIKEKTVTYIKKKISSLGLSKEELMVALE